MRQTTRLIALLILLAPGLRSVSQKLAKPSLKKYQRCYTSERAEALRKINPAAETDAQFESWLGKKIADRKKEGFRPLADYTIPVVFHIVHNGEAVGTTPNIDAGLVQEQLIQLNKDYANLSNSPYSVAAATGLQFVLSQNNPTGTALAEPGIDRIDRNSKGWTDYTTSGWDVSYIDGTVKPASIWDATRYLNVWIIPQLDGGSFDILGYSTLPGSSTLQGLNNNETANTAGVVVLTSTVGSAYAPASCGTGYGLGKTLSHETGHFFGLRHIWGDANCGTDYCDDTPIHQTANTGTPSHPKSNGCGTADEMFENYMDYSDDIVLNTFTANQVERMQTVMLNSPRRLSLSTSNVGAVSIIGSNRAAFINCTGELTVSEKGVNASYPRYKDISLTLNLEGEATGSASVAVTATGTAVSGVDYQLLTPTLTFATGDNFKPINIRIFDNPRIDNDRNITISYTVSGTGIRKGTDAQSLVINLLDDDNMRVGENTINLLDEHFENPTGGRGLPAGWQLLTTTGYVNQFVASTNGDAGGSGLAAHVTNNLTTKPNTYTNTVQGVAVLQSPAIDAGSVLSLGNLSFKYKVRGLPDNDDAILTYSTPAEPTTFYYYGTDGGLTGYGPYSGATDTVTNAPVIAGPSALENKKFNLDFYWETSGSGTGVNPGFNVDDIVLTATPFHVETDVSNSYTFDILAGTSINNFKSTNNKAIASITNASANISGVIAQVTQGGTGNTAISTNTGSYLRTQKVFRIAPLAANTTVTYQGTLFFTTAELAAWGADRLNLKILKVKDGVSLSRTTLDATNAEIITATVFEDATAGYITYSGNFTGFSQFMLVSPLATLPVTFINFQATALQKNIQLIWSSSQELDNRGYFVDRSLDGVHFTQVGWVDGNGTTTNTSTYTYVDNYVQRNVQYYYRVRQVDKDNRQAYSLIRDARLKAGAGILIKINPNPVKDYVNLFITGTSNKASVELINNLGQLILRQDGVNAYDGIYKLQLNGLAKGVYNVLVYLPEGAFANKIVVQ